MRDQHQSVRQQQPTDRIHGTADGEHQARPARRQRRGSPCHAGPGLLTMAAGEGVEHDREHDPRGRQDSGDPGRDTPSSHPPIMLPSGRRNNRAAPWLRASAGTCPTQVLATMPSDRGGHSFEMSGQLLEGTPCAAHLTAPQSQHRTRWPPTRSTVARAPRRRGRMQNRIAAARNGRRPPLARTER